MRRRLSASSPAHAARELYAALWRHAEGARGQLTGAIAVHQASRALADFAQNQFAHLQNIVNFFGPLVALTLLSAAARWRSRAMC